MATQNKVADTDTVQIPEKSITNNQIPPIPAETEIGTGMENNQEFDGDISLSSIRKKRFRIDGDNTRILEIDTSDMTVLNRLESIYPKLQSLSQEAAVQQLSEEPNLENVANALKEIDTKMRAYMDEIFDADVSRICAPSGSMFDPFNGEFRFEHIIATIGELYTSNIATETKKIAARMKKHTAKYHK